MILRVIIFATIVVGNCCYAKEDDNNFMTAVRSLIYGEQHSANATTQQLSDGLNPGLLPSSGQYPSAPNSYNSYPQFTVGVSSSSSSSPCGLPQQIGTGPYRIPRWYFNPARMRCELFYWSGCCGNGNNFNTFQSCQQICEVDPCSQEREQGVGALQLTRYFFNKETKLCEQFIFFGSASNRNNFNTLEECQNQCPESPNPCAYGTSTTLMSCAPGSVLSQTCSGQQFCHVGATPQTTVCCNKPATNIDRCSQPLNVGVGNSNLQRWYFNPLTQQCQPCFYKGLQGNENNFLSRQDCENSCAINPCKRGVPYRSQGVTVQCSATNQAICPAGYYCHVGADSSTSVCCQALGGDPCGQPMDRGMGGAQLSRWYWDQSRQCCLPFSYCGQKGTQNNFLTKQDCEQTCFEIDNPCALGEPQMISPNEVRFCSISNPLTCAPSFWCHFGSTEQTTLCCPGRVEPQEVCQQPMVQGTGNGQLFRWYYNSVSQCCIQFTYRGREGNQNNFLTREECEDQCVSINVCPYGEPQKALTGGRPILCSFNGTECEPNHFCHLGLVPDENQCCPGEPTNPAACQGLPPQEGIAGPTGTQPTERWYYEVTSMSCKPFTFDGRKGNQNNFLSEADCAATCQGS